MYTNILHTDLWSIFTVLAVVVQVIPAVVVLFLVSKTTQERWVR